MAREYGIFGFAPEADLVFYLDVKPYELFHRVFQKYGTLDYYEAGADIGISDDLYDSFVAYQNRIAKEFAKMAREYGLIRIDGNRPANVVNEDLQGRIDKYLDGL